MLQFIPCAVVMSDIETMEVLGYSPAAVELFGIDQERYYQVDKYHVNPDELYVPLQQLQQNPQQTIRVSGEVLNTHGQSFHVVGSVVLRQLAGRTVMVASIEPGRPLAAEEMPE